MLARLRHSLVTDWLRLELKRSDGSQRPQDRALGRALRVSRRSTQSREASGSGGRVLFFFSTAALATYCCTASLLWVHLLRGYRSRGTSLWSTFKSRVSPMGRVPLPLTLVLAVVLVQVLELRAELVRL